MSPLLALLVLQAPLTKEVGLTWSFPGTVKWSKGRYELVGKEIRGEVVWFTAPNGRFEAEALYKSDTQRTKEADETREFSHVRTSTTFAGLPAIASDQRYMWKGAMVASRCVYAVQGNRAWVVRLWWPRTRLGGGKAAEAFLQSCRLVGGSSAKPVP